VASVPDPGLVSPTMREPRDGRRRGRPAQPGPTARKAPAPKRAPRRFTATAWMALAPTALAVALYGNTFHHDYVLDDDIAVRQNKLVQQGLRGLPGIFAHGYLYGFNGLDYFYRPLSLAAFAVEVQVFGNDPRVHHAVNIVLFAACAALFYLLLVALLAPTTTAPDAARAPPRLVALVAALLFAAHPIHTEVVANIKGRDELLCLFFILLALRLLIAHVDHGRPRLLAASLGAFALAVLAKESALAALGLVPLTLWFFRPGLRRLALMTALFAIVAVGLLFLGRFIAHDALPEDPAARIINNALASATHPGWRFASSVAVLGRYLSLLLWPRTLSYDYSYNQVPVVGPWHWRFLVAAVAYVALLAVAAWGSWRRRTLAYAILWYAVMMVLVSNLIVPLGTVMGERLVFAASAGFCLGVAWLLVTADARFAPGRVLVPALAVILGLFSLRTITRNLDWRNAGHLYASGIRTAPHSARAWDHYSTYMLGRAQDLPWEAPERKSLLLAAITGYQHALEILPGYTEAMYNMGVAYGARGDTLAAQATYERTLRADSTNEGALHNLAGLLFRQGRTEEARGMWLKVLAGTPQHDGACANLGATYVREGDVRMRAGDSRAAATAYRTATEWFLRAHAIAPRESRYMRNLATTYARLGNEAEARRWFAQIREP
jgi:protein O-mannosyl-transferase